MNNAITRGPFAELMRVVLDESNTWSRSEWAYILSIEEDVLESWVKEEGIPSPENLCSMWSILCRLDNVPNRVLELWKDEEHRPWRGVKQIGNKTMRQYMATPVLEGFIRTLQCLPGDQQEEVLYKAAELAREAMRK